MTAAQQPVSETLAPDGVGLGLAGFSDIVTFVEQTTARIWDDKNPGLIGKWYTPTTLVHTSDGDIFGADAVIAGSLAKMAAFPDIKDHVEETIWTARDGAYRTSMRWTWTGRNTGWSVWGSPTGRQVTARGIANCVVVGGHYLEEWVVYDELTTLRQLGIDVAAELSRLGPSAPVDGGGENDRRSGQAQPDPLRRGDLDDLEWLLRSGRDEIWNRRMVGQVAEVYAENAVYHGPNGRELVGVGEIQHEVLSLLAMLPNARMHLQDVYANVSDDGAVHAALCWTLIGTHTGPSRYGPPTGRRVKLLGLTHQHLRDERVVEEWSVYSELSLLRQIMPELRHRPSTVGVQDGADAVAAP